MRRNSVQRIERDKRGQGMVEFALILVPFFLLVLGIFDLGRGIYQQHLLSNAAREAARAGNTGRSPVEVCEIAARKSFVPNMPKPAGCTEYGGGKKARLDLLGLKVRVDSGEAGDVNDPVKVELTYQFKLVTPFIADLIGSGTTLSASSNMYVEYSVPTPNPLMPTPTPNMTPTPMPTATATPTATPVPSMCSLTTTVPRLNKKRGYYYTITTQASGTISASWTLPGSFEATLAIYAGTPLGAGSGESSSAPPPGALASDTRISSSFSTATGILPAGQYTVYFYNGNTANLNSTTTGNVNYMKSGCP
ncbi:MAG: pilus assembly protein [Chloroflexi bacterium]|nr:pilus assembly protein [Chloroflexota bacterium]